MATNSVLVNAVSATIVRKMLPAVVELGEHVGADGAVGRSVDPVVLLFLHREVRPQDLLERILLLGFGECVVRAILGDRLVIERLPGQLLDLLMSLGQTLATHVSPQLSPGRRRQAACSRGRLLQPGDTLGWRRPQRRTPETPYADHHNPVTTPWRSQHETTRAFSCRRRTPP